MELHKKWLLDFNAGETLSVSFDFNLGGSDMKMDGSVFGEKPYFKILEDCLFCIKWIGALALPLLLNLPLRKLETLLVL